MSLVVMKTFVLPEDVDVLANTSEEEPQPPIRQVGDEIYGFVEIATNSSADFEIMMTFKGTIRTHSPRGQSYAMADSPNYTYTQFQIFKEIQILSSKLSASEPTNGSLVYKLPFHFTVPEHLVSPKCDIPSAYLQIPGTVPRPNPESDCHNYEGRFSVKYELSVSTFRFHENIVAWMKTDRPTREIVIVPSVPASPPLPIRYYPREYWTSCSKALKKRAWDKPLATLEVSVQEPCPLEITTRAPQAATLTKLRLDLTSLKAKCASKLRMQNWVVQVTSYITAWTFYTTKDRLQTIPTLETLAEDPSLFLIKEVLPKDTRQISNIEWLLTSPPRYQETEFSPLQPACWTAELPVTVNCSKKLVPTFLNPLAARRYGIVFRIKVLGLSHDEIEVKVPVQIVHSGKQSLLGDLGDNSVMRNASICSEHSSISDQWSHLQYLPEVGIGRILSRDILPDYASS
ncbi:hypothetical protein TWF694_011531 [Orbilia ellipsospora]|uniref:Arrestin-like N-terminal domain-containing protein n=1 Tax=Orbilia ellipsospora TaxID=2528407 RepID=A0AAV9X5J6_9PEZI